MSEKRANRLTYYIHDEAAVFRFQLAGDLSKDSITELDQARETTSSIFGGRPVIVDLTGVASVDTAGRQLIEKWHGLGAQFVVTTHQAKVRIQSLTGVPFRLIERNRDRSKWLPGRLWRWMLAAMLVFPSAAAVKATHNGSEFFEATRNGIAISAVERSG